MGDKLSDVFPRFVPPFLGVAEVHRQLPKRDVAVDPEDAAVGKPLASGDSERDPPQFSVWGDLVQKLDRLQESLQST